MYVTSQQEPQECPIQRTCKTLKDRCPKGQHWFLQLHTCDAGQPSKQKQISQKIFFGGNFFENILLFLSSVFCAIYFKY